MNDLTGTATGVAGDAAEAAAMAYHAHHLSLVRLAVLLPQDVDTAGRVVEDAFVATPGEWPRPCELDKALIYLRRSVVTRSRSASKRKKTTDRRRPLMVPVAPSAGTGAVGSPPRTVVMDALGRLPGRRREALVPRYCANLSEAEIAGTMRLSRRAVNSRIARGMAALRRMLESTS